jgi:hypothetical protein
VAVNIAWVFLSAYAFFFVMEKLIGNRVDAEVEQQGLDVHELGVPGYINEDPKVPERHIMHATTDPRPAVVPPDGANRYTLTVSGLDGNSVKSIWSKLCQPAEQPPDPDFLKIYPYMTTVQDNRFRFRGGDSKEMSTSLSRLFGAKSGNRDVKVTQA